MNVPSEQYPLISNFVAGGMVSAYYEWIINLTVSLLMKWHARLQRLLFLAFTHLHKGELMTLMTNSNFSWI